MDVIFRFATRDDLPTIVAIYNEAVVTHQSTGDLEPITVADRTDWFASFNDQHPLWVLVDQADESIVGWVALEPFYGRAAFEKSAEVAIYLKQNTKGQGLGQQSIKFIQQAATERGLVTIVAYVLSQNSASQHMFERSGFSHWGYLPEIGEFDGVRRGLHLYGWHTDNK
ncbi:GNAT family N-acetyltransferase [Limosilactobacillus equigenerosi]|uniref:Phosphinothricin N-acetyltransferase n=1 Tax=Limosilactobacillus equigenerosi DSM 18793 = JCM 14505 TaxID=1423742 RepID=A0A0R1UUC2_9LACO|nr:GNAT family N-acetyltransferase [Limosilactobacillus equigenerosi]KRL96356.1 Phosphinothricin N-acetyltransferase [Limosilactobacillus equigenerosi DSM 18793 = JCM 14505]